MTDKSLSPEEIRANLNGVDAQTIRLLAAQAIGLARARDTRDAKGWRDAIVRTYQKAKGLNAHQRAASGGREASEARIA